MKNIKLRVSGDYEWLIDTDTNKTLAEGHKLRAEDVLFALGYRFDIEEAEEEE